MTEAGDGVAILRPSGIREGAGTIGTTPQPKTGRTTVALVGAGRVATALGVLLERAGLRVVAASGREGSRARLAAHLPSVPLLPDADAARLADVVVLGFPDDLLPKAVARLAGDGAFGPGRVVAHLSGAVGLSALRPAAEVGALALSLHPLQSIPDVASGVARLPGSAVAVTAGTEEAYAAGEALASAVGGRPFRLDDAGKPLYHAAAVFCSNYVVAVLGVAERLFRLAGVGDPGSAMAPLARAALEGALERGAPRALTGPAARGDAGTLERNLAALARHAPETVDAYVSLAREAARLAHRGGRLADEGLGRVEGVLARWR